MRTIKSDKATNPTGAGRSVPDFGAVIDRMKAIAAQSGDTLLLGNGPPHPDAALLELCAEIAYGRKVLEAAWDRRRNSPQAEILCDTRSEKVEVAEARRSLDAADKNYSGMLRAAGKIKATTASGIYAKALAVRSSKTGAALLAMSLAEDMLSCVGLRQSLWPVEAEGA